MSRSTKAPIFRTRDRSVKPSTQYWRKVRRATNNTLRKSVWSDELELPSPKEIMNDCDYREMRHDARGRDEELSKWRTRWSRK